MKSNGGLITTTRKSAEVVVQRFDNGVESYELSNANGMNVTLINYGAAIAKIEVPDRDGNVADILLGHEDIRNYVGGRFYLGATVGRYANRIAEGRFTLHGREYQVSRNRNGNHLHGGTVGFDKKFWSAKVADGSGGMAVEFGLVSPDGDEGFPGQMDVKVVYTLTGDNELRLEYSATTDRPTVINLTNHSYFNLTGSCANTILDHILSIDAESYTVTDAASLPTGEIRTVGGTPLDFRKPRKIGDRISDKYEQLDNCKGYDSNWVLNEFDGSLREAAVLYEPRSGRLMTVLTNQPGLQFYSGNYLDGTMKGKGGVYYAARTGLCLECQHFPNSPNIDKFPSTTLEPGETYMQTTVYRFSTDKS